MIKPLVAITATQIANEPIPPLDWLVEDLWIHGDKIVCAGESRAMKSWIMLDLLIHLAAGRDWLGFKVPQPRRVLYVDEEMNQRTARRRVKRLAAGAGIDLNGLPFVMLNQQGFKMTQAGALDLLTELTKLPEPFDPEVIVGEAFVRILMGNENEAQDVAKFWSHSKALLQGGQRTLLVTHHLTKPGDPALPQRNEDNRTRGSGDILAGCDEHFSLTRQMVNGQLGKETVIKFWKSREGEEHDPLRVTVVDVGPHDACKKKTHSCPAQVLSVIKKPKSQPAPVSHSVPPSDSKLWEHPAPSPA